MDSPRAGVRKATAASWALAALGVAGAVGATALAYSDTAKTYSTDSAPAAIDPAVIQDGPAAPTATPTPELPPGFGNVPLAPGYSSTHTRAHGS